MDPSRLGDLPNLISEPRFARYLARYPGRPDLAARLYAWNIELTSAFWGPVSVLEVTLRNTMHDALAAGREPEWWSHDTVRLLDRDRSSLDRAIADLARKGVVDPEPGQVVAALNFSFWVGLTGEGLPRHPMLSYETALWQPRLVRAFPGLGAKRRKQLHRELDEIRVFRNRLAHHEPIFNAPLARIHDDITAIASSIHPQAEAFITGCSRVVDVLGRMEAVVAHGRARF